MASFALLLVASATLVIGLLQSSVQVVCLSVGGNVVAGIALAMSVLRGRPPAPPNQPAPTLGLIGTVANSAIGSGAPPVPTSSGTGSTDDRGSMAAPSTPPLSPAPPPSPRSALELALELKAPGAGLLGRLRRRPLAERETPRPPLTALAEDPRPKTRRSRDEGRSAASRPSSEPTKSVPKPKSRSTSVSSPEKVADGSKRAAERKVRVPPGTSVSRPRATGKHATSGAAATGKAARTAAPPGGRQASRGGGGGAAKTQARPVRKAARE